MSGLTGGTPLCQARLLLAGAGWAGFSGSHRPLLVPEGIAQGPVAEVFAAMVRTRSADGLLQHARSVPTTKICVVSTQGQLWSGVGRGGASAVGVPDYLLPENVWAFVLIRPDDQAAFTTIRAAEIGFRAADIHGWPKGRLTVVPAR